MTLEQVISNAVADALNKQLQPILQPLIQKLNIKVSDVGADEEYLTTPEAARFLKVSPITMSIWRHEKRGPEFKVIGNGRGIRYKLSVLKSFLERNDGLVGKKGRPTFEELESRDVATSGLTTGRVKKPKTNGGMAKAGK